ncbi:hypothetical protein IV53_GL000790 [Ligilactobacillus ceti DSM 22408]|uniref:LssY-like C-terminal domain-containing protein n=1 Tax=Ligilactobacillus ceti DSM 22408 TaxID=1122146 RepID=A0A0R2KRU2_9LACO|nr:hypothetical protein IV53_GL000790 [Ligilactobacillus ceti DSM 22408]
MFGGEKLDKYPIPKTKPEYHYVATKKKKKARVYIAVDRFLTVYGFLLVFAYALTLLLSSFHMKLSSLIFFVLFWCMLSYIALPRLHSFLTTLYLPDYFLSRTKTGDGILGDPVNISILGTEADIHAAMRQAGWTKADPITLRSSLGIIFSTLKHKPYPAAPVSSLYLFNRKQDFAYQMEVNGSASQRHHVRFWKVPEGWHLPGGKKVEWLAAGTFDKGVGLTSTTLQVTHKIDKDVDKERDYIIESLLYIDHDITVDVIDEFTIPYHDENGGGDPIETDGNMPIVDLHGVAKRAHEHHVDLIQQDNLKITKDNKALNKELPPKSLIYIGTFMIIKLVLVVLSFFSFVYLINDQLSMSEIEGVITLFGMLIGSIVNLVLYILTLKKFKWSRLIFLIIASISATLGIINTYTDHSSLLYNLVYTGVSIAVVIILSSPDIRQWVYTIQRRGE